MQHVTLEMAALIAVSVTAVTMYLAYGIGLIVDAMRGR
jgi:hypothetical protein